MSDELLYVLLLFGILIVPRALQRFRLPSAITCFAFGAAAGMQFGWFRDDPTVGLLSTFGIVALFLFAGLEVSLRELREKAHVLAAHVLLQLALLVLVTWIVRLVFPLAARPALLVALALITPSTGFILDSLASLGLDERERFWVRSKAIATEVVALVTLFVVLQSTTVARLSASTAALIGLIVVLPLAFRLFARVVLPHAPHSEFAFLILTAVSCALVTRHLGVYYLVGAFVVGLAAQRMNATLPALSSQRMLHAVQAFASVFVPFYFFHAGLGLRREDFSLAALALGLAFLAVVLPVRIAAVMLHRRVSLAESWRESLRVGVPMVPTLVFTLVLAGILRDRFDVDPRIFGGLIVYTVGNTLVPGFVFSLPTPELDVADALEERAPEA